jgi:hypothetical protein
LFVDRHDSDSLQDPVNSWFAFQLTELPNSHSSVRLSKIWPWLSTPAVLILMFPMSWRSYSKLLQVPPRSDD